MVSFADMLSAFGLLLLASGMSGVTYRAGLLLIQMVAPKPLWLQRGALLWAVLIAYLTLLAMGVPGILAALSAGEKATIDSASRTILFGTWLWVLNTILLMLARGKLGPALTGRENVMALWNERFFWRRK